MPIMRVDANYRFIGPQGEVGLLDLFEGRMQLMIYRFFYAEDVEGWPDAGCNGLLALRRQRHPSRAPQRPVRHELVFASATTQDRIEAYRERIA